MNGKLDYILRPYRAADAPALAELTVAAIIEVGAAQSSAEQIAAWAARHPGPERFRQRHAKGDMIFIAADADDAPVAYALLEADGHLDMLYCSPGHLRRGLARRLLDHAEQKAKSLGLVRLYTEASELARPAFERAGYAVTHRRDFEIDGVPIHNYAMEKALA